MQRSRWDLVSVLPVCVQLLLDLCGIFGVEVAVLVTSGTIFTALLHHDGDSAAFVRMVGAEKAVALVGELIHMLHYTSRAHGVGDLDLSAGRDARSDGWLSHLVLEVHLFSG